MHRHTPLLIAIIFVLSIAVWGVGSATTLSTVTFAQRATETPGPSPTATSTPVCPTCRYVALIRAEILPTATPTATPTETPEFCAAEYPTVCIPPPPPDLDCSDIEFQNFTVLPPDRHGFDTDRDGIGCEH
jgi:hypothetical protein